MSPRLTGIILLGALGLAACSELLNPKTGWKDNYGTHDLILWDGQAVPTPVRADGSVVKGCIMLDTGNRYTDLYTTTYYTSNVLQTATYRLTGAWSIVRDSINFEATDGYKYSAPYDSIQHQFTLIWLDYLARPHSFTYKRRENCR